MFSPEAVPRKSTLGPLRHNDFKSDGHGIALVGQGPMSRSLGFGSSGYADLDPPVISFCICRPGVCTGAHRCDGSCRALSPGPGRLGPMYTYIHLGICAQAVVRGTTSRTRGSIMAPSGEEPVWGLSRSSDQSHHWLLPPLYTDSNFNPRHEFRFLSSLYGTKRNKLTHLISSGDFCRRLFNRCSRTRTPPSNSRTILEEYPNG